MSAALAPEEAERQDRAEQQRSQPRSVAAHRALDQERAGERSAVNRHSVAEQALLGWQRHEDSDCHQDRRLEAGEVERLGAALREGGRDQQRHPHRHYGELQTLPAALRDRIGDHAAGQEQRRDGAREGRQHRESDCQDAMAALHARTAQSAIATPARR
jgi:hypothetical protein